MTNLTAIIDTPEFNQKSLFEKIEAVGTAWQNGRRYYLNFGYCEKASAFFTFSASDTKKSKYVKPVEGGFFCFEKNYCGEVNKEINTIFSVEI